MMKKLEEILHKLKNEKRDNKTRVNDLLSHNTAYEVAIMLIEEQIEKERK